MTWETKDLVVGKIYRLCYRGDEEINASRHEPRPWSVRLGAEHDSLINTHTINVSPVPGEPGFGLGELLVLLEVKDFPSPRPGSLGHVFSAMKVLTSQGLFGWFTVSESGKRFFWFEEQTAATTEEEEKTSGEQH